MRTPNRMLNRVFALLLLVGVVVADLKVLGIKEYPHRAFFVVVFSVLGLVAVLGCLFIERREDARKKRSQRGRTVA